MDARSALPNGLVLDGGYEVRRVLGVGGFGITYAAFDRGLGKEVALKEYYPAEIGVRDRSRSVRPRADNVRELFDRLKQSFVREARTLSQFNHPAIVRELRVFEAHGTAYMVMDYESGPTLKAWLAGLRRKPTQDELDRLAGPLLSAIGTLHEAHFLHRDIAPDNIIVRPDGTPVLLDFGATRRVMAALTSNITGLVKMGYSPMEQYASEGKAQGPWTDIYALGATLYRCIAGREPQEATLRVLEDSVVPATEAGRGGYRAGFLAAIDAALAIRPEQRPQSVQELRRLLLGPEATAPSATRGVGEPGPLRDGAPEPATRPPAPEPRAAAAARRMLPARGALVLGLVALLAGGGIWALGRRAPTARPDVAATAPEAATVTPASTAGAPRVRGANASDALATAPAGFDCAGVLTLVASERRCLKPGEAFKDCAACPAMVVVPAGEITIGAGEGEPGSTVSERPVHDVAIRRPFAAARFEVTRGEFRQFVERERTSLDKGCTNVRGSAPGDRQQEPGWSYEFPGYAQDDQHPVACVSWHEAVAFAASLSRTTGFTYRLLSEAEWEYAARAGSRDRFFFGTDEARLCDYGNIATAEHPGQLSIRPLVDCRDLAARTAAVGSFKANAFGLHDTIGNLWEWVQDCSEPNYIGAPADGSARTTAPCTGRVARGGSWGSNARLARSAARWHGIPPATRMFHLGFRVARTLD